MKLVCARCETELRTKRIGCPVIEMFLEPPRPYQIWAADLLECPKCHAEIAVALGMGPMSFHFDKDFEEVLAKAKQLKAVLAYERSVVGS